MELLEDITETGVTGCMGSISYCLVVIRKGMDKYRTL